jgi:hypothetical protein
LTLLVGSFRRVVGARAQVAALRVHHVGAHARDHGPDVRRRLPRELAALTIHADAPPTPNLRVEIVAQLLSLVARERCGLEDAEQREYVIC